MKEEMFEGTAKRVRAGDSRRFIAYGNDHDGLKEEKAFFEKDAGIKAASFNTVFAGRSPRLRTALFIVTHRFFPLDFWFSGLDSKRGPVH